MSKRWIVRYFMALAVGAVIALGFSLRDSHYSGERTHLVRCWLPTGSLYKGYTKNRDFEVHHSGTVMFRDLDNDDLLTFTNIPCVVAYDRPYRKATP